MRRLPAIVSDQRGQATIEFGALLPMLLIAGLFAWQMALIGWTATSASNAARTASRTAGRGGDGVRAGLASLSGVLRSGATVQMHGYEAEVRVKLPLVFPGLQVLPPIPGRADLPPTTTPSSQP